ncbi:hypothetical protein OROGR_000130 [Orobanche gracilis]
MALHVRIDGADAKGSKHSLDSEMDEANSRPIKKLKSELNADDHEDLLAESLHSNNVKLDGTKASSQFIESSNVIAGEGKVVGMSTLKTEANEAKSKVLDASRNLSVGRAETDKPNELAGSAPHTKRELSGPEGSLEARKRSSGLKHWAGYTEIGDKNKNLMIFTDNSIKQIIEHIKQRIEHINQHSYSFQSIDKPN